MSTVAEALLLGITGLGYLSLLLAPLTLLWPFLVSTKHPLSRRFTALGAGIGTLLVGAVPCVFVSFSLISVLLGLVPKENGAYDGTGLAFLLFAMGAGTSVAAVVAMYVERRMLL